MKPLLTRLCFCLCVFALCLLAAAPSYAQAVNLYSEQVQFGGTFQTSGQSMWGTGAASITDKVVDVGTPTISVNPTVGGIGCFLGVCAGAEAGLNVSGSIGIELGAHVDSGSVDASLPFNAIIQYNPTAEKGTQAPIGPDISFQGGAFTATPPNIAAWADLNGSIYADAYATGCAAECWTTPPYTIVDSDFSLELASFNRNNDGELRILTVTLPLEGSYGPVTFAFALPETVFGSMSGIGDTLQGSASTDVAHLGVDFASIIANALGVPIDGSYSDWLTWTLISAQGTLDTYLDQTFKLDPGYILTLYVEETGQTVSCTKDTLCLIDVPLSDLSSLTIDPYLTATAEFFNNTGLVFAPGYYLSLLSANVVGLSIGPAWETSQNFPLAPINLFDEAFAMQGFNTIAGPSFQIAVTPEPTSFVLLGSALLGLAGWRKRPSRRG